MPPKKNIAKSAASVRGRQTRLQSNKAKDKANRAANAGQEENNISASEEGDEASASKVQEDSDEGSRTPGLPLTAIAGPLSPLPGEDPVQLLVRRMRLGKAKLAAAAAAADTATPPPAAKKRKVAFADLTGDSSGDESTPELTHSGKSHTGFYNSKEDSEMLGPEDEVEDEDKDKNKDKIGVAIGGDLPEPPSGMNNEQKRAEVKRLLGLIVDIILPV